jgi:drug/metabolite transporter (DMT)-like permease
VTRAPSSFAAFGQQHTGKDLLAFTGLYNLVGLLICLSLKIAGDEASFDCDGIGLNLCNGFIALSGSIFVLLGYKSSFKVQTAAIQYLRLPATLCLASLLFSEEITMRVVIGSTALLAIAYGIAARPVSDAP